MILIGFVFLAFVASAAYILYFPKLKESFVKAKEAKKE